MADDFSYNIEKYIGVISEGKGGWKLELNKVSWGGRPAKYDIRSWDQKHEKMSKGLTLSKEDLISLKNLISDSESSLD